MGNEPAPGSSSTVSVPIAWATFGGSTCLLFLLCYLCQKKLQDQDLEMDHSTQQVYVISAIPRNIPDDVRQQPPPDYESALRAKNFHREAPPSYEIAVSKDMSSYSMTL